ncbi:MAG: hypothetical protein RBG13Loki_1030 [Promethearchaeota archaeon CR_4]|nr:MAG: hypothetical protein RBG13Loki_1030 [Candidatus Lokiarchaeota archaeon CR_4]
MVKRIGIVFILILGLVSFSLAAEKKEAVTKKEKPKAAEVKKDDGMVKKIQDAIKELDKTLWNINVTQITSSEKKEKYTDKIRFKDDTVAIETLVSQGFPATSFTITIKGDENNIIIWETMQSSEKKGLAFLKGELEEGRMRGVLSRHIDEKTVKDYSFYSTSKEVIQEEVLPAETTPAASQAAPSEEVKKEEAKAAEVKAIPAVQEEKKEVFNEETNKKKKVKE